MALNDNLHDKLRKIDNVLDGIGAEDENSLDTLNGEESLEHSEESMEHSEEPYTDVPAYLLDQVPTNKTDIIKWSLLRGKSEEDLIAEGFNSGTVRNCAHELRKEGLYQKSPREDKPLLPTKGKKEKGGGLVPVPEKALKTYSKGSPAEELIQHFAKLPDEIRDGRGEVFESGMKFGLSVAVLGIRMAQELSNLGVSQVKPLIDMTKSMREGEALAAKTAAVEAATEAAGQIGEILGPTLQDVRNSLAEQAKATTRANAPDPMRDMIAETMKPLLKGIIGQMMPGGVPGMDTDEVVSGWTKKKNVENVEDE